MRLSRTPDIAGKHSTTKQELGETVLKRFFRKSTFSEAAVAAYERAVEQGRNPCFYRDLGVPDSVDGRFDLISIHVFLTMRRLRREGEPAEALGQDLSEIFFADMDVNLRELGASDIGVGRRVKRMIEGFYGRVTAYEGALESGREELCQVLRRNLYGTTEVDEGTLAAMADYVERADKALEAQAWSAMGEGRANFPDPATLGAQHD